MTWETAAIWMGWTRAYPAAARRMRDEVRMIATTNPQHRVHLRGAVPMRELADAIKALAEAHAALQGQIDARVQEANSRLAQERTRLAALMAELTHGVLVCNREGRILLYNAHASALLEGAAAGEGTPGGALVGLNRSVFGLLDRGPIVHAMEQVARRLEQSKPHPVARFVTTRRRAAEGETESGAAPTGQLLRAQLVSVQGADPQL